MAVRLRLGLAQLSVVLAGVRMLATGGDGMALIDRLRLRVQPGFTTDRARIVRRVVR